MAFRSLRKARRWSGSKTLDDLPPAQEGLLDFTHRNLLEVDGRFEDQTPATYRLQPALRQEIARRAAEPRGENAAQLAGYAAYADWFVEMAYGQSGKDIPIARLFQNTADELVAQTAAQPAEKQAAYCWQLGYTTAADWPHSRRREGILERGAAQALTVGDEVRRERILFQQANLAVLRGDLERGLKQYEEAAQLAKAEENQGEYGAVLHQMAQVFLGMCQATETADVVI